MTYKELKEKLEQLTDEQLNQTISFEGAGLCGSVAELKTAQENWFCNDWSHPGMCLDKESNLVRERQHDKKDWGEDDWNIYHSWYAYLEKHGSVFKKGDVYLEINEDSRVNHQKVYFHNVSWG